MMNEETMNEAKTFIRTHFQKSEWKSCRLTPTQLADLVSTASNIKISSFELEKLLKEMGYRHHQKSGRYMMRLSDRLIDFARDRMCLFN